MISKCYRGDPRHSRIPPNPNLTRFFESKGETQVQNSPSHPLRVRVPLGAAKPRQTLLEPETRNHAKSSRSVLTEREIKRDSESLNHFGSVSYRFEARGILTKRVFYRELKFSVTALRVDWSTQNTAGIDQGCLFCSSSV